jgi:glutamyl-tRNA synthetase/glutamyl-Q tRNA(Asp) synthetase
LDLSRGDRLQQHGRFAPTTSGPAHPGTLLAALLCWLDARSRGAFFSLRLEDVDSVRCTEASAQDMRDALRWLGVDWDAESLQSLRRPSHEAALDHLAKLGVLYPCSCSRSVIKASAARAADGGWRYPGNCRQRPLPGGDWRASEHSLRLRLPPGFVEPPCEGAVTLGQDPTHAMGDPVLLRHDGSIAYHLACVVDDSEQGVTRIVRGRDLAPSTAIHVVLQRLLEVSTPAYRHHLLFLEESGSKLAKLHGAVGWRELRDHYSPEQLCGMLAWWVGLRPTPEWVCPSDLIADFDWQKVCESDLLLCWTGSELLLQVQEDT